MGIYLDNAATSFPKPECVASEMMRYVTSVGCNTGRGRYATAYEAEDVVLETRTLLKELFNGPSERSVILTSGVTMSLNIVIGGLLKSGDHVIVSPLEHNAVMRPLSLIPGLTFDRFECDSDGIMKAGAGELLAPLLRSNTKAVLATHASNVSGTVLPIGEIGRFCSENGLFFITDCAQTAGTFDIDMARDHIDAVCFTGHKGLMGPQGTGGVVLSDRLAGELRPIVAGGTGSMSHLEEVPSVMPDRFEPGTPNLPGIYGLHASLGFIRETGTDNIRAHEDRLCRLFLELISDIPGIRVPGHRQCCESAAVVSVFTEKVDPAAVAYELDENYGIMTRVGLHCAPSAHRTFGTYPSGTVRFSFGYFNTEEDVRSCAEALRKCILSR